MSQVKISVHRPIIVNLDADRKITLPAGVHTVDQEVADHWYVKANSEQLSESMVNADELEAAHQQIAELTAMADELRSDNLKLLSELEKSANDLSGLEDQKAGLEKHVAELQNQIELLSAQNAELQSDAAKQAKQNSDLTAQVAELQKAAQPPTPATEKKGK